MASPCPPPPLPFCQSINQNISIIFNSSLNLINTETNNEKSNKTVSNPQISALNFDNFSNPTTTILINESNKNEQLESFDSINLNNIKSVIVELNEFDKEKTPVSTTNNNKNGFNYADSLNKNGFNSADSQQLITKEETDSIKSADLNYKKTELETVSKPIEIINKKLKIQLFLIRRCIFVTLLFLFLIILPFLFL